MSMLCYHHIMSISCFRNADGQIQAYSVMAKGHKVRLARQHQIRVQIKVKSTPKNEALQTNVKEKRGKQKNECYLIVTSLLFL